MSIVECICGFIAGINDFGYTGGKCPVCGRRLQSDERDYDDEREGEDDEKD